jgi:DNA modification methylase
MMTLMQGDCLERMKEIETGSVDAIIADPPYGTTACKWDSVIPFAPMWEQLKRIIKPNGAIVLFGSQPFTSALVMSNVKMFKYCWVWDKVNPTGHLNAKIRPMKKLEDICVFSKEKPAYFPQGIHFYPRKKTRNAATNGADCYGKHGNENISLWKGYPTERIKIKNENGLHPTQKPGALLEYLIKTYTHEGETVLDFTMGSGTTGVAAKNTNRHFIGIEKDPDYFAIAQKRIEATPNPPEPSPCASF